MKTCTISGNEVIERYSQNAISGGEMEVILEDSPCPGGLCDADVSYRRLSHSVTYFNATLTSALFFGFTNTGFYRELRDDVL